MQPTHRIKFLVKKTSWGYEMKNTLSVLLPLIAVIKAALLFTNACFFPHSSLSQEWHFSQLNQGRIAPKSHQPMWKKASCTGWEQKEELTCVWLLPLPSFLEELEWCSNATRGGVEKRGNWAKPGLGEPLQQSLCLSFLIPIFSFALPKISTWIIMANSRQMAASFRNCTLNRHEVS